MADATSREQRDSEHYDMEKKLRKREKRLLERLQEAQLAQANAAERFQRAEARLLKRMARTQRLEAHLATLRQQHEALASSIVTTHNSDTSSSDNTEYAQDNTVSTTHENENDAAAKARAARTVAEATEVAARFAIERALHVAARLEQMATGRHLSQELLALEAEAARASVAALDAELAAQEAERLAGAEPIKIELPFNPDTDRSTTTTPIQASAPETNDTEALTEETQADTNDIEVPTNDTQADTNDAETPINDTETPTEETEVDTNATEMPIDDNETHTPHTPHTPHTHTGLPTPVERERVEEIDEDEGMVEMVAAMMIADVAAANAAKAESLAEEASTRTAEARRIAQEADVVLERIRAAIRSGTTTGDAAEAILFDAERDATRAHAMLADAESAEERARRAAMEAEAEAEVAEGMAFATEDRNEHDEIQREEVPSTPSLLEEQQHTGDTGEIERINTSSALTERKLEDEDTIEVPIVRPQ